MKSPLVSREAYDVVVAQLERAERRVDELTTLVATMRQLGFVTSKPGSVRTPVDVEQQAKERGEAEFAAKAKAAMLARGVDSYTAEREAERLYAAATDFDPVELGHG